MKLTKAEKKTLELARKAVRYLNNGDPMKDALGDSEAADALELLISLADKIDTSQRKAERRLERTNET